MREYFGKFTSMIDRLKTSRKAGPHNSLDNLRNKAGAGPDVDVVFGDCAHQ